MVAGTVGIRAILGCSHNLNSLRVGRKKRTARFEETSYKTAEEREEADRRSSIEETVKASLPRLDLDSRHTSTPCREFDTPIPLEIPLELEMSDPGFRWDSGRRVA